MTRLDLLLVAPPQPWLLDGFSNGLVSLAGYVRRHNADVRVQILDLSHTPKPELEHAIAMAIRTCNTSHIVAGITTTTAAYQSALITAQAIKSICADCFVLLGGHHVVGQADLILQRHSGCVDAVISGEGEIALSRLLADYPQLDNTPGISYLDRGCTVSNPPPDFLDTDELDQLTVSIEDSNLSSCRGKFDHITYVSARGCPRGCNFCAVARQRYRAKSISAVKRDLRFLSADIGYCRIAIEDNFFAHCKSRTLEICDAIRQLRTVEQLDISWDCQTRVESVCDIEVVEAMASAGCEAAYIGVESLCEDLLRYLGKTNHPADYLSALESLVVPGLIDAGIGCYLNIQLGLATETAAVRESSLRRLETLGKLAGRSGTVITVFPQLHVVYPGTRHFLLGAETGQFPYDVFESFTSWEAEQEPVRRFLGEHFAHGTGGIPIGILLPDKLRMGAYEICSEAIDTLTDHLDKIGNLTGVEIFGYERHLIRDNGSSQNAIKTSA